MSFLKNLFSSSAPRQETVQPRKWPEALTGNDSLSPEALLDKNFVYSRVFELVNKDDQRNFGRRYLYLGAHMKWANTSMWHVDHIFYDFADDQNIGMRIAASTDNSIPLSIKAEAIPAIFQRFERQMIEQGNRPLKGSTDNYRLLATNLGLHFTDSGDIFSVDPEATLKEDMNMSRQTVARHYQWAAKSSAKAGPIDTWEGFYARYVDILDEPALEGDVTALRQHPGYKEIIALIESLSSFSTGAAEQTWPMEKARKAAQHLDEKTRNTAIHLMSVTRAVMLLRAGAHIIDTVEDFDEAGNINEAKINKLKAVRSILRAHLQENLHLQPEEARKASDIILKGSDPRGPQTPVASFYKKYPALDIPKPEAKAPSENNTQKPPRGGMPGMGMKI